MTALYELFPTMSPTESPAPCPHGLPFFVSVYRDELRRAFALSTEAMIQESAIKAYLDDGDDGFVRIKDVFP